MPATDLILWSQIPTSQLPAHEQEQIMFPFDPDVNDRFALWSGDIATLDIDAVTNTTNECMNEINKVSEKIFCAAGSGLKEEIITEGKECLPGDVCITSGHGLRARHIIHTVGPNYTNKQHTAAETVLSNCYVKVLNKCKELNADSVALCLIHSNKKAFPPNVGVHVALRTIRGYLERERRPRLVVLWCPDEESSRLAAAMCGLYFPRSSNLTTCGSYFQQSVAIRAPLPERKIRIIDNPQQNDGAADDEISLGGDDDDNLASLARQHLGADTQHLLGVEPRYPPLAEVMREQIEHQERYNKLLQRAHSEDLNEISGIGCLYQCGVDRLGRPVVVFVGKWFPVNDINLDKALLYLIKLMDPIVRGDYVIAYFHTLTSSANYPPFAWLKEVYTVLPYKYKKNLKAFYIVHPTFWTKMMTWWFTTFMAPAIKQKVHNLPGVEYLYAVMTRHQLEIPAFITEYDMTINGLHYFQPETQSDTS